MPYIIESNALISAFPRRCTYCDSDVANTTFHQSTSTLKTSLLWGATSQTVDVELPACEQCARWFRTTRVIIYIAGAIAIIGFLPSFLVSLWFENALPVYLWHITVAAWVVLRLWRVRRRTALRLAYFNLEQSRYAYAVGEERYAKELAEMNGLACVYKPILFKLS